VPLAAYDLGDLLWSFLVFFAWIIFFWLLFIVFGDLFRRHDISGWGKAGWTVFVIILPFLGVLIYLIANGQGMAERSAKDVQAAQQQTDAYIRSVAGGSAEQIAKAKELLDKGAITQAEFEQLKAKALAAT
jgi:Short C-terminal domain/Phospholipase_D-nuclease N-terminal